MAYEYVTGDKGFAKTTIHADGTMSTVGITYRPSAGGGWTKVAEELIQSYYTAVDFQTTLRFATNDIGGVIPHINGPIYVDAAGYHVGVDYVEAVRYLVANGTATMAQAETLLSNCVAATYQWDYLSTAPDTLPATVVSSDFNISYVKATEMLHKTDGRVNDTALMATLANGASMPWSIPAGMTSAQAAVADWAGSTPTVYGSQGTVISNAAIVNAINTSGGMASSYSLTSAFTVTSSPYVDDIQKVYIAFFNRPADPSGLNYWANYMSNNNGDVSQLMAAFGPSAEYQSIYAGKTTAELVDAVYQNLFARAAEPDGAAYWANMIDTGRISVANAAYTILNGAQSTDKTIVDNKTSVSKSFTETLNDSAKIDAYSGYSSTANARAFLNTVTAESSSVTTATAGIANVLKTLGISGSSSGSTITLDHVNRTVNILSFSAGQTQKTVTVTGFSGDKIDVSDFAFTGTQSGSLTKTGMTSAQTTEAAGFFGGKGVAIADTGSSTHVYVDANKDGNFTPNVDFDINLVGVHAAGVTLVG